MVLALKFASNALETGQKCVKYAFDCLCSITVCCISALYVYTFYASVCFRAGGGKIAFSYWLEVTSNTLHRRSMLVNTWHASILWRQIFFFLIRITEHLIHRAFSQTFAGLTVLHGLLVLVSHWKPYFFEIERWLSQLHGKASVQDCLIHARSWKNKFGSRDWGSAPMKWKLN